MQRGKGNKVKKSYGRRSPLREPITIISSIISAAAGAVNKSNKKAAEAGGKKIKAGIKMNTSGMDAAKAAVGPMKGGLK